MSHGHIALPLDGSGKKVPHSVMLEVKYFNGTVAVSEGQIITFGVSTFTGTVVGLTGTTSTGTLDIRIELPVPSVMVLNVGEDVLADGTKVSEVQNTDGSTYYFQQNVIVGGPDMNNHLEIDEIGSAKVKFDGGSPQFDAFGSLQVSNAVTIGEYLHPYDHLPEAFGDDLQGAGTITHIPASAGVLLSNTTAAADQAHRKSHTYHKYQAGVSQLIEMTVAVGDTGKANVIRTWGYGDSLDGVFFRLNGLILETHVKNSTGTTAATVSVPQSEWNVDRLDGSEGVFNNSKATLDVSKDNIYWIDFQWLGAGRIRFGVFIDGVRLLCHQINNANNLNGPFMRSGSLPVHIMQVNTGITASTSELSYWCFVVKTEGVFNPPRKRFAGVLPQIAVVGADTYLGSFRSKQLFKGVDNRVLSFGEDLNVYTSAEPISVQLYKNSTLTGATYAIDPSSDSSVELDIAGTVATPGRLMGAWIVSPNESLPIGLKHIFNYAGELMRRHSDITSTDVFTFTVSLLNGTTTNVNFSATWSEVQ